MRQTTFFAICAMAWAGGCQLLSGVDDFVYTAAGSGGRGGASVPGGGAGGTACTEPADCPGVETSCTHRVCDDGLCGLAHADAGAACSEGDASLCDGAGRCVECLTEDHCEPDFTCQDKECVALSCVNGALDAGEADVDCGGTCARCDNGASCGSFADCASGFCDLAAGGGGHGGGAEGGGATAGHCAPCEGHDDCTAAPDTYCDGGSCVPRRALGTICADDAACSSGHCVDGRCCDEACDAGCVSCLGAHTNAADGTCAPVAAGTDPSGECLGQGAASCGAAGQGCNGDPAAPGCILYDSTTVCVVASCDPVLNEETLAASCDGMGSCDEAVVETCFPYSCNAAETACKSACGGDVDCAVDAYCMSNVCLAKQAAGATCSGANQCASGHCVDGRCCESACGGTCRACSQGKTGQPHGTCAPIPSNQDPDGECLLSCNGNGACQL